MYKIKINNMKFNSNIGVLDEEKVLGQVLEVDLEVKTNFKFNGIDNINNTLSYVDFYEITEKIVGNNKSDLIEKLAYDIIHTLKENINKIDMVKVKIRKNSVPIKGYFDNVEIEMEG